MTDEITKIVLEHISTQISHMKHGEISDCEGLFDPDLWDSTSPLEHRYVFGRRVSMLVEQGKVHLEFAGFDRKRHNLYRKI